MTDPFAAYAEALNSAQEKVASMSAPSPGYSPDQLISALRSAEGMIEAGKGLKAATMAQIDMLTAGQSEARLVGTKETIVVSREDREAWDQDKLKNLFGNTAPSWVKTTYSIPATTLKALDPVEAANLLACRKITSTKLNVTIESN